MGDETQTLFLSSWPIKAHRFLPKQWVQDWRTCPSAKSNLDYIKIQHHDAKEQGYHAHLIAEVRVFVLAEVGGTEIEQCYGLNSLWQGQGLIVLRQTAGHSLWNTSSAHKRHIRVVIGAWRMSLPERGGPSF